MALSYDVAVVGAGPAGSATAYHAARGGRRVLLIDRSCFPREKTCGDAVSPRGVAALHRMGVTGPLGWQVRGARFVRQPAGGEWYEDFGAHDGPGWGCVVRRAELDARLLAAARAAGADVLTAVARDIDVGSDGHGRVTLAGHGERIRVQARAVVLATGSGGSRQLVRSGVADTLPGWGIAARGYFESAGTTGRELRIYFPVRAQARLCAGYVWAFPVDERCWNLGVGIFRSPSVSRISLRGLLRDFLSTGGVAVGLGDLRPVGPVASAPIAVAPLVDPACGLLPVGDAAGLANPFTGEGIAAALESGELAGRVLANSLQGASQRYAGALATLFPGRAAMRPALRAMYEHPDLFLGRGADAVTQPTGLIGGALRGLVWDTLPRIGQLDADSAIPPGLADMRAVLETVVAAGKRMRPLFGELLAGILADPRSRLGWSTAFALAAARHLGPRSPRRREAATALLGVVEIVTVAAALHGDLLSPEHHPRGDVWGRNTVGLALADTLTAEALRRLYTSDQREAAVMASAARRFLRAAAVGALTGEDASTAAAALLLAATAIASGRSASTLPAWVGVAARQFPHCGGEAAGTWATGELSDRVVEHATSLLVAWRRSIRVPPPTPGCAEQGR